MATVIEFSEEYMLFYLSRRGIKAHIKNIPEEITGANGVVIEQYVMEVWYVENEQMYNVFERVLKNELLNYTVPKVKALVGGHKPKDVCACGKKHPLVAVFGKCCKCWDAVT